MHGNIYDVVPAVSEKLEWLAMGFNKTAFADGKRCLRSELTEMHIGFCSLKGKTSISDSRYRALRARILWRIYAYVAKSSKQASSPKDNPVPNVPRMNCPTAQISAAQSPGQVSESSLIQRSGEDMVKNRPESPWVARELDHFYQNDLYDVLRSPVQEGTVQEDVIRQAKTELKHHVSAVNKHLAKKAALEEKSKCWELDGVSRNIVDSDEDAVDPFQTGSAIKKRILDLEEALMRQDLAIRKHNTKKATLERGIKRHSDYEPWQPSKKPVSKATQKEKAEGDTSETPSEVSASMLGSIMGSARQKEVAEEDTSETRSGESALMLGRMIGSAYSGLDQCDVDDSPWFPYQGQDLSWTGQGFDKSSSTEESSDLLKEAHRVPLHSLEDSSSSAKMISHHVWDPAELIMDFGGVPPINSQSVERQESKTSSKGATFRNIVKEPTQLTPFEDTSQQQSVPRSGGEKSYLLTTSPGRSIESIMDEMSRSFERVAINVQFAREP